MRSRGETIEVNIGVCGRVDLSTSNYYINPVMGSFRPDEEKKKPETQEERLKRYSINFHPRIDSQKSRKLCVDIMLSLS